MDTKPQWMENEDMKRIFDSLPPFVQENIMQSSVEFHSSQELSECADKLQRP